MASSAFRHGVAAEDARSFSSESDTEMRFQNGEEFDPAVARKTAQDTGETAQDPSQLGEFPGGRVVVDDDDGSGKDTNKDESWRYWRGNMTHSIRRNNGNMSKYSDDCLSVHGLYYAFYSGNGKLRTLTYLIIWLAAGALFLYLTIPLIEDYRRRTVATSIDTESEVTEGLALPIITVCQRGRGIRCDCQLWRKLHCRYLNVTKNEEWRKRFSDYGCFSYFETETNPSDPEWINPRCEDFEEGNEPIDSCGPEPSDVEQFPMLTAFRGPDMYKRILSRESSPDGPYITQEELAFYAPSRFRVDENVFFMKEGRRFGLPIPVPKHWIKRSYIEESQLKTCVQVRPPPEDERQYRPGALSGISVLVTGVKSSANFPLQDLASSTAALNLHVNSIDRSQYDDVYLPVEVHHFMEVPAGNVFEVEYNVETFDRYKGWGPLASRQCKDTTTPRSLCVQDESLARAALQCGCKRDHQVFNKSLGLIYACSASVGTSEYECTTDYISQNYPTQLVSLKTCPTQCSSHGRQITSQTMVQISDGQLSYFRSYLASIGANTTSLTKDELVFARVGAGTLLVKHFDEEPSTSLGALIGQIGGNAGLWCGLSFVMMFEVFEFCTVAGFYALRKWRKNKKQQ